MINRQEFDIALSFASENRDYVDQVANLLRDSGVKVFYDLFEEANLWGKNLYDYLSDIYINTSDSLRSDSTIITEVCEGLAGFYGTEVEF